MKIYLAAPWIAKEDARAAAAQFDAAGFTITKRWWEHREVAGYLTNDTDNDELREQAVQDMRGVYAARAFVLLNPSKSEGKAVEMGLALAMSIPVLLIGNKSNLFHYLGPNYITEVADVAAAIRLLEGWNAQW